MFNKNDILNFAIANAKDKDGNHIDYQLRLPLEKPIINLPENAAQVGFFEYHQDNNTWDTPFNIFIGKKALMQDLCKEIIVKGKKSNLNSKVVKYDEPLAEVVYIEDASGILHIYNKVTRDDIIVESQEQLIQVIEFISDEIKQIGNHISHVRNLKLVGDNHKKIENR